MRARGARAVLFGFVAGDGGELPGDGAVAAAARHFVPAVPLAVVAHPVLEYAGHHEANVGRLQAAAGAFGRVGFVARGELGVERRREQRAGGRFLGSRFELDPPFVAAAELAGCDEQPPRTSAPAAAMTRIPGFTMWL